MIYAIFDGYYPGEDENSIFLENDKVYSYKEFEELIIQESYPEKDDEDYIDEYTTRSIYGIAEQLCDKHGFNYVVADLSYTL